MDYNIDAKDKIFGRLCSDMAQILQGKKSADYEPRMAGKDKIFLKNYKEIKVSGNKLKDKIYYNHTGYMGHLKEKTFEQAFARNPKQVIRDSVRRMMPKNFLNQKRLNNLFFVD